MPQSRWKTPVAVFDDRTLALKLNKRQLSPRLLDGTKIRSFKIVRVHKRIFLERSGLDRKRNCHIVRNELTFAPDGSLMLRRAPGGVGGTSATGCIGDPCSACKISADGTECSCKRGKGKRCNHTITTGLSATAGIFIA
jgi:hypothetical protein